MRHAASINLLRITSRASVIARSISWFESLPSRRFATMLWTMPSRMAVGSLGSRRDSTSLSDVATRSSFATRRWR